MHSKQKKMPVVTALRSANGHKSLMLIFMFFLTAIISISDGYAQTNSIQNSPATTSAFHCPHDPKSDLPCADTDVPEPRNVAAFWRKLTSIIRDNHGYVSPEQFEHIFGIRFSHIEYLGEGHRSASFDGGNGIPLSIQLDDYVSGPHMPLWQNFQGDMKRTRSVLNMAGGDFGCIPLHDAEKNLTDAGLSLQGAIIYKVYNNGKSITEFADLRNATTVTLYYDRPAITGSCVLSMRVIGYK